MRDVKDIPNDGTEFIGYSNKYGWLVCSRPSYMSHYKKPEVRVKMITKGVVISGWLPISILEEAL